MGMYGSFLCMIILFSIACNSSSSSTPTTDTVAASVDTPAKPAAAPLAKISGFLNILYVDAASFLDLKNEVRGKLTFRFYLKQPDSLTLSGWSNDGNSPKYPGEPPKPNITLWVGGASAFEIGNDNYFGNLVLYNKSIKNITDSITKYKSKFILFVPLDPAANYGQVTYKIYTTTLDPHAFKLDDPVNFAATAEVTNPSPPKGAFN